MAEKSDEAEQIRLRFELLLLKALEEAEAATDNKTNYALDTRMRMLNSGIRCCSSLRDLMSKEDKMSTNEQRGDHSIPGRDELRAEIERRLARIRATLEDKSVPGRDVEGGDVDLAQ